MRQHSRDACARQHFAKHASLLRALVAEHVLVHEVKWAGYGDEHFALVPFAKVLDRYASYTKYLEHVSYWVNKTCKPAERQAMLNQLHRLPLVRFDPHA